jgi:MFS family permease
VRTGHLSERRLARAPPTDLAAATVTPIEVAYPAARQGRIALCVLTLAYVLSFIDRQLISLLVEPLKRDLRITDVQVSLLQGLAFASIYCLCGLPCGRAADQFSRRNIIMAGVGLWSLMTGLCGLARTYTLLLLCRAGVGVGEASLSPSAYSMLSDYFPPRHLPTAMSFYNLGPAVGSGLAYMLGGVVLEIASSTHTFPSGLFAGVHSWQLAFVVVGALGSGVLILLLLVREPPRRMAHDEIGRTASFAETLTFLVRHRASLGMLFIGLSLLGVLSYATMTWYPTMFVRSFDQTVSSVGLTFGPLYIVSSVVGTLGGGWGAVKIADRSSDDPYVRWVVCAAALITAGGWARRLRRCTCPFRTACVRC